MQSSAEAKKLQETEMQGAFSMDCRERRSHAREVYISLRLHRWMETVKGRRHQND